MTFDALLDTYRELADSERMKGNYFEQLVAQYLTHDGVQAPQYKHVWLWRDWPGRGGKNDNGIDLVGEREGGGLTAIQAKFYAESHTMSKTDIDSFISASGKAPFTSRLVVSTTANWTANAEEMLDDQHIPVQRVGLTDLRNSNIDWSTYVLTDPGNAPKTLAKKELYEHQHEAVSKVMAGFVENDRGKMIMACGTGKTYTSLRIAERFVQHKGHARVLFMVPSLALMSQSLKEWSDEASVPMHAYAVCSDIQVGRQKNADLTTVAIHDLQIPATTSGETLVKEIGKRVLEEGMTVVFSTYQSIDALTVAQQGGLPDFDLVICDEAHRTTGVTLAGEENSESHFVKIHSNKNVSAAKRLYMTATPRLFNDETKDAAREKDAVLCSMDDIELYGPVFYRIGFGEAVTKNLLSDYKVLVLGVEHSQVASSFQASLADSDMELQIDDVAKLIGCWNGLAKRRSGTFETSFGDDLTPMKRAVAFNRDIKSSKLIASEFEDLVRVNLSNLDNDDPTDDLRVEVRHVDGGFNAVARAERLDWLKAEPESENPVCRILSNARCLTEGVDVPSLDAVLFMNPRNSMVDVIQAVGRVMRRSKDKKFGYIILPIAIPEGMTTSEALRDNKRYRVVWQVLQALRAHDERMNAAINQIDLNEKAPESIVIGTVDLDPKKKTTGGIGAADHSDDAASGTMVQPQLVFPAEDWKDAVYAKIVDKCGTRMYWRDWATDIAEIAAKHIVLINAMLSSADAAHRLAFDEFVDGLRENLNPEIDEVQAVEMLAQHLVTKPVFDAMFEKNDFTAHNPVSVAMQKILDALDSSAAFENERTTLEPFYASVRERVKEVDNAAAKQKIIVELYDNFFRAAFPRVADRLGIVFTPVPVVDYILRSADEALHLAFGKRLTDEGVSIIDPFVGTGTFVTRLLQTGLIKKEDLLRKYTQELFANEIVLLSYYIAAINIETAFAEAAEAVDYEPFDGIVLTDTFQLNESDNAFQSIVLPENSERVQRQRNQDITVVVMNPPYSAGQGTGNDNNTNQDYPLLKQAIRDTYMARSNAKLKNKLADSYVLAIRWASNRIQKDGVVAFVSNGSFIDANYADGLRRVLADEFSQIFVYNLRGNQRHAGEESRREGGKIFGSGARTPIAITILVKSSAHEGPAQIHYSDIGDYRSREDKLDILDAEASIAGTEWVDIAPSAEADWVNHRDERFDAFQPLGQQVKKESDATGAIFGVYSNGLKTNRDAWVFNFSPERVATNVSALMKAYEADRVKYHALPSADRPAIAAFVNKDSSQISWSDGLRDSLKRNTVLEVKTSALVTSLYRPFTKQFVYFDRSVIERMNQLPKLFPTPMTPNLGFFVPAPGSLAPPFFTLMTDCIPDLGVAGISAAQIFCRWAYRPAPEHELAILEDGEEMVGGFIRRENVTPATVSAYRKRYGDDSISAADIFYFAYGLLHHPDYTAAFAADLKKLLPRIPLESDFKAFTAAGRELGDLHVNYETAEPYALVEELSGAALPPEQQFAVRKMSFLSRKDNSAIVVNPHLTLSGIPTEAHAYMLGARSALGWLIERYKWDLNKDSQLINDPNDYSRAVGDPRYIVDLVKRIVTVSLETRRIVASLPKFDI